ncbi:nucleotidyltransferase domain-containing protein [candidate division WOR-3 bacterium]|nr:nucleotidyltransferase domain-containing protein [candidate division WOR-3 bacterium]
MKISEKYRESVNEFVRRALEKYGDTIDSIILFGSVARGEAKEDSDVDILVIGDVGLEELVNISFPILLEHGKLISAKNVNKAHFDFLVREGYSFARNILREGIILYERVGEAFGESGRKTKILSVRLAVC